MVTVRIRALVPREPPRAPQMLRYAAAGTAAASAGALAWLQYNFAEAANPPLRPGARVCVVGAGVVGVATAFELAAPGATSRSSRPRTRSAARRPRATARVHIGVSNRTKPLSAPRALLGFSATRVLLPGRGGGGDRDDTQPRTRGTRDMFARPEVAGPTSGRGVSRTRARSCVVARAGAHWARAPDAREATLRTARARGLARAARAPRRPAHRGVWRRHHYCRRGRRRRRRRRRTPSTTPPRRRRVRAVSRGDARRRRCATHARDVGLVRGATPRGLAERATAHGARPAAGAAVARVVVGSDAAARGRDGRRRGGAVRRGRRVHGRALRRCSRARACTRPCSRCAATRRPRACARARPRCRRPRACVVIAPYQLYVVRVGDAHVRFTCYGDSRRSTRSARRRRRRGAARAARRPSSTACRASPKCVRLGGDALAVSPRPLSHSRRGARVLAARWARRWARAGTGTRAAAHARLSAARRRDACTGALREHGAWEQRARDTAWSERAIACCRPTLSPIQGHAFNGWREAQHTAQHLACRMQHLPSHADLYASAFSMRRFQPFPDIGA